MPFGDGYCYLYLFKDSARREAKLRLGTYPTVEEVRTYVSRASNNVLYRGNVRVSLMGNHIQRYHVALANSSLDSLDDCGDLISSHVFLSTANKNLCVGSGSLLYYMYKCIEKLLILLYLILTCKIMSMLSDIYSRLSDMDVWMKDSVKVQNFSNLCDKLDCLDKRIDSLDKVQKLDAEEDSVEKDERIDSLVRVQKLDVREGSIEKDSTIKANCELVVKDDREVESNKCKSSEAMMTLRLTFLRRRNEKYDIEMSKLPSYLIFGDMSFIFNIKKRCFTGISVKTYDQFVHLYHGAFKQSESINVKGMFKMCSFYLQKGSDDIITIHRSSVERSFRISNLNDLASFSALL